MLVEAVAVTTLMGRNVVWAERVAEATVQLAIALVDQAQQIQAAVVVEASAASAALAALASYI